MDDITRSELEELVTSSIKYLTKWAIPFTAFNLTKHVRSKTDKRVLHNDVKDYLSDCFQLDHDYFRDYNRTLIDICTGNSTKKSYLYHPVDFDLVNYDEQNIDDYIKKDKCDCGLKQKSTCACGCKNVECKSDILNNLIDSIDRLAIAADEKTFNAANLISELLTSARTMIKSLKK